MEQNSQKPSSPYVFVLEEGKEIRKDPMDYSLMLLHTQCSEKLHAPLPPHAKHLKEVPLFTKMGTALQTGKDTESLD